MTQTALILGASGRFGRHVSAALTAKGWVVRRFDRKFDDLAQAAQGVDVIVNGWNPLYPDWAKQVPALHAQVIAAAKATGAMVLVPGNVYVYGPQYTGPWTEGSAHRATNPLGRIRRDMEAAYRQSGVKTLILRAGDFIDTEASGNWFDMILTKSAAKGVLTYPGRIDARHSWAYLPDLAKAAVGLLEKRQEMGVFEEVLFSGYTLTANEMAEAVARVMGRPLRVKPFAWLPLRLLSPFWPMGRCLLEMSYLWNLDHSLDGARLADLLPKFKGTPLRQALATALPVPALVEAA